TLNLLCCHYWGLHALERANLVCGSTMEADCLHRKDQPLDVSHSQSLICGSRTPVGSAHLDVQIPDSARRSGSFMHYAPRSTLLEVFRESYSCYQRSPFLCSRSPLLLRTCRSIRWRPTPTGRMGPDSFYRSSSSVILYLPPPCRILASPTTAPGSRRWTWRQSRHCQARLSLP